MNSSYQQNIDLVKGFFKKPIVLFSGIISLLTFIFFIVFSSTSKYFAYNYSLLILNELDGIDRISSFLEIPIFLSLFGLILPLLFGIVLISLFCTARKQGNGITKAISFFKGVSVFTYIYSLLNCLNFIFTSYCIADSIDTNLLQKSFFIILLLLLTVIVYIVSHCLVVMANSFKKSVSTIYLRKSGSLAFGLFVIIITVLVSIKFSYSYQILPVFSYSSIFCVICFFAFGLSLGIIAIKYHRYIRSVDLGKTIIKAENADTKSAKDENLCERCGNELTDEDIYCPVCGTKAT